MIWNMQSLWDWGRDSGGTVIRLFCCHFCCMPTEVVKSCFHLCRKNITRKSAEQLSEKVQCFTSFFEPHLWFDRSVHTPSASGSHTPERDLQLVTREDKFSNVPHEGRRLTMRPRVALSKNMSLDVMLYLEKKITKRWWKTECKTS